MLKKLKRWWTEKYFRATLSKGPARFKDPETKQDVYQWTDKSGGIWLAMHRFKGPIKFFSFEDLEQLPRQQRRKALRNIKKKMKK